MSANDNLGPQFVYHGTARPIEGDKILPANVHGRGSYWDDVGSGRNEPANAFAWAHPDEDVAWDAAIDRTNVHYADGAKVGPRARVYALHQNEEQSPGHDPSMAGEIKAPHFDIAHPIDTRPGHQGTFPEINWNEHARGGGSELPGDEDANHPSPLSVQFGHRAGVRAYSYSEPTSEARNRAVGYLRDRAREEDMVHTMDRVDAIGAHRVDSAAYRDDPLPSAKQAYLDRRR